MDAVQLTEREPQFVLISGDRTVRRREVDGVIVEVSSYPKDDIEILHAAYPVNGMGVVRNVQGRQIEIPLDRSVLRL